ncbi:MAG: hypothetical protein AUH07_05160 [Gemmatimonadetes bacterium 13_2_20CM_70_9]|nr:MAG: hypothetical protein AUH07_05160 [Gemmatimonadetes bacterium 13_2_20CM_70_9]
MTSSSAASARAWPSRIYDPIPLESARETAALLHAGVIELATGHAPHVEATEEFVRALDPFLPKG